MDDAYLEKYLTRLYLEAIQILVRQAKRYGIAARAVRTRSRRKTANEGSPPNTPPLFVGQVVDVLEVMQTDHQPRRLGWPADRAISKRDHFNADNRTSGWRGLMMVSRRSRNKSFLPDDGRALQKHRETTGSKVVSGILQYFKPAGSCRLQPKPYISWK